MKLMFFRKLSNMNFLGIAFKTGCRHLRGEFREAKTSYGYIKKALKISCRYADSGKLFRLLKLAR